MLSRQDGEGLLHFLLIRGLLYVSTCKNDTLPLFFCTIVPEYNFSSQEQIRSLLQKTVWFLSSLALKLSFVFIGLFFFNLNFQNQSLYSLCWKTTLQGVFLGYPVEHSTAFRKNNARTGNPTCPLFPVATLGQWPCSLKIDSLDLMMQWHTVGSLHMLAFINQLV